MLRDKEGVTFQENFNHEKIRKETPMGQPISIVKEFWSELEEVIREGGRRLIQSVLEEEVNNWVESMSHICDEKGRRLIRRNGYSPERAIHTGMGPVQIRQPRARNTKEHKFTSSILPKYMRRVPSLDNLIPVLYLKGLSTSVFPEALESIIGPDAKGFSAKSVERLKARWVSEFDDWNKRSLEEKRYVYVWADGIHFNVRLGDKENKRMCFLVLLGSTVKGKKELVAVLDGYRESKASWLELLRDLQQRGLKYSPNLAIGDGALGFWAAMGEVWPDTKTQRCWVHKTANVLDKMPKSIQAKAKKRIHDIYLAETKEEAEKSWGEFFALYDDKYPKACECLAKDKDELLNFYSFPAANWIHIRTTNPIESTFATVRHRSKRTKGCGSRNTTLTMVFKLCQEAEKNWRRLRGYKHLSNVIQGIEFRDGYTEQEWVEREKLAA